MGKWHDQHGEIDILVHAIAFAKGEDLDGQFVDTSRDGFALALDVSAYSLVALCREAPPTVGVGVALVVAIAGIGPRASSSSRVRSMSWTTDGSAFSLIVMAAVVWGQKTIDVAVANARVAHGGLDLAGDIDHLRAAARADPEFLLDDLHGFSRHICSTTAMPSSSAQAVPDGPGRLVAEQQPGGAALRRGVEDRAVRVEGAEFLGQLVEVGRQVVRPVVADRRLDGLGVADEVLGRGPARSARSDSGL